MEELGGKILVICGILVVLFVFRTKDWYGPAGLIYDCIVGVLMGLVVGAILLGIGYLIYRWWKK